MGKSTIITHKIYLRNYRLTTASIFMAFLFVFPSCSMNNGSFTDERDGKTYETIKIGNQTWMAQNLSYRPKKGNCWISDMDSAYIKKIGYYYDWKTACIVCPKGWHLPSDSEWKELEMKLGMTLEDANKEGWRGLGEGGKLKMRNDGFWKPPNTGANNLSGFSAVATGWYNGNDSFNDFNLDANYWTSTETSYYAWSRSLSYSKEFIRRFEGRKKIGFSVRCVKD